MIEFPTDESRWIWLAGVMDCDSCICLSRAKLTRKDGKRKLSYRPNISFEQTSKDLINEIANVAGEGTFVHLKANYNYPNKYSSRWRSIYRVVFGSPKVRLILPKVIPYLVKKKDQAILLNEATKLISLHNRGFTGNDSRLAEIFEQLHSLHEKNGRLKRQLKLGAD
ncbi:MAG: hypothetical protein WC365_06895 [Candidatus Babeliales bacterium]